MTKGNNNSSHYNNSKCNSHNSNNKDKILRIMQINNEFKDNRKIIIAFL